ncbi:hypothetical protein TL16_g05780 [Triparma laevis f. inornata]|uniref:MYND-type domain-containing protein n=2 Tax=Triparma laevis TaxID=1534972 RepID=A0A9W7FS74_9STRA|nr:hypothetical protein TL16_g05780 [Triparma laevis f. inornata]GMI17279.1 hypothetical protein TrLO_g13421 [Triparma laevis f. longispina]
MSTLSICPTCSSPSATLRCSRCYSVSYCNKKCQKSHWKSHKKQCALAAKNVTEESFKSIKEKKGGGVGRSQEELNFIMGKKSLEEARRELKEAQAVVERLQKEAAVAQIAQNAAQLRAEDHGKKLTHITDTLVKKSSSKPSSSSSKTTSNKNSPKKKDQTTPEYGSKSYWEDAYKTNTRYNTSSSSTYEWYWNSYTRMLPLFRSIFSRLDLEIPLKLMDCGCGNSTLLADLLKDNVITQGYGLDISSEVIELMSHHESEEVKYHYHDLTSPVPPQFVKSHTLEGAIDKGTIDAILSGGHDETSYKMAVNAATAVILNVFDTLKVGGKLLIFSNLPPKMALDFFNSVVDDVVCVAAYDPNVEAEVKLGTGLKEDAPTTTIDTPIGKIKSSTNVHVYKLTKVKKTSTHKTLQQLNTLSLLQDESTKALKEIQTMREKGGRTVEGIKKEVIHLKEASNIEELGKEVDAAATRLGEMALEEHKTAQAQETMDSVVAAGHDKSLAEYAKYKGREMQGVAKFVDDENREVGTWSQNREDVNIIIDCKTLNMKSVERNSLSVVFTKNKLSCSFKRFDASETETEVTLTGEFEEDENVVNINKTLCYKYSVNESTWFIEDNTTVILSLVKTNVNEAWERLGEADTEVIKFRDYEKVGKGMLDEDDDGDNDGDKNNGSSVTYDSELSIVYISDKHVKVNFALTPKKGLKDFKNTNVERDYVVLCDVDTPYEDSFKDYIGFEYLFDDDSENTIANREASSSLNSTLTFPFPTISSDKTYEFRHLHVSKSLLSTSLTFTSSGLINHVRVLKKGLNCLIDYSGNISAGYLYLSGFMLGNVEVKVDGDVWAVSSGEETLVKGFFKIKSGKVSGGGSETCAIVRLEFASDFDETVLSKNNVTSNNSSPIQSINALSCGFCELDLFKGDPIKKNGPLPSYYWDEISDYLSCHTEASVAFNSNEVKATQGKVWEDDRCFLCDAADLGERVECLNGVEGYGEKEGNTIKSNSDINFRGTRVYTSTGLPISCTRCCSTLGYCNPENPTSVRLYKHLVSHGPLSKFLVHELIRYATSLACYVFCAVNNSSMIVVKLINWDGRIWEDGEWKNVTKVVWNETGIEEEVGAEEQIEEMFKWVDECCLPGGGKKGKADGEGNSSRREGYSKVKMQLSDEEYREFMGTLKERSTVLPSSVCEGVCATQGFVGGGGNLAVIIM